MNRTVIGVIIVIAIVAAMLVTLNAKLRESSSSVVILATFPGIADDVRLLVESCNITVESIAPPGIDPHSYNLGTKDIALIKRATLIVTSAHAPFELQINKIVSNDKIFNILNVTGIELKMLPNGVENLHMPVYDPDNYEKYVESLAQSLSQKLPGCEGIINSNLNKIKIKIEQIKECKGVLQGKPAVLGSPVAQYAVEWLGLNTSILLSYGEETQATPEAVQKAVSIMKQGGYAIVVVDANGKPIGKQNQWLYNEAKSVDSPIILVKAPFVPGSIIEKLQYICSQIQSMS